MSISLKDICANIRMIAAIVPETAPKTLQKNLEDYAAQLEGLAKKTTSAAPAPAPVAEPKKTPEPVKTISPEEEAEINRLLEELHDIVELHILPKKNQSFSEKYLRNVNFTLVGAQKAVVTAREALKKVQKATTGGNGKAIEPPPANDDLPW